MIDPRISILDKLTTEKLVFLLGETLDTSLLMSPMFLAIGMSKEFAGNKPIDLFDIIVTVLRSRFTD